MKDKKQVHIAKNAVRSIINEYKRNDEYLKENIRQSLTSNYQNVIVQGGYSDGQNVSNQILDRADKEQYIKSVEDILRVMPSTFRKIIINRFFRKLNHEGHWENKRIDGKIERVYIKGIMDLLDIDDDYDLARTTYFRWYDKAIETFYNETLARMIEMKINK